jgi:hypothetical protein
MLGDIEKRAKALADLACAERHSGQLNRIRGAAVDLLLAVKQERVRTECPFCRGKGYSYDTELVGEVQEQSGPAEKCIYCDGTGRKVINTQRGGCDG